MDKAKTKMLTVRLPGSLIEALDRRTEAMAAELPGARLSRSDVIRVLLLSALKDEKPKRR